jgi:hypothetical protein
MRIKGEVVPAQHPADAPQGAPPLAEFETSTDPKIIHSQIVKPDLKIEARDKDLQPVPLDDPTAVRFSVMERKESKLYADGMWVGELGRSFKSLAEA